MELSPPKYQVLADWLRRQISEGKLVYGQRCYSEHRLCEMFGFSRQTVRQAIAILENEKMLDRRQGSGTFVVWRERNHSVVGRTIGVISTYVDNYIFPAIIRGIEQVLSANDFGMQLMFTYNRIENEARALHTMLEKGVDGVIAEPAKSALPNPNLHLYRKFQDAGIPVLLFNAGLPALSLPCVAMDDVAVGRVAHAILLRRGTAPLPVSSKATIYKGSYDTPDIWRL